MSVSTEGSTWRSGLADRAHLLLVGDAVAVTGLIVAGELSHDVDPLASPLVVADTLAPFLLGWFLAAPLLGAFAAEAVDRPLPAARLAAGVWLAAANVGLVLRGSPLYSGGTTWPFPLVITGIGMVVMVTWRVAASRLL